MAAAGFVLLAVVLGAIVAAPWLRPVDPTAVDTAHRLAPFTLDHPLGTDMLGRDMAARILQGGRTSVMTTIAATAAITLLGLALGVAAGYLGGIVDNLIMRVVELIQALPMMIVVLVAARFLGTGIGNLVLIFAIVGWPAYARVVRVATLSLRERDFVMAARAAGSSRARIVRRHILPNLVAPVTVLSTLDLGRILLGLSALGFLGFGVQPPQPEWGRMLADARSYFYLAPHLLIIPGVAISLVVLAVNLCGDGLRDALDVKVGRR